MQIVYKSALVFFLYVFLDVLQVLKKMPFFSKKILFQKIHDEEKCLK